MKYYDIKNNFLAIEDKYSNFKDSKIVILSIPYEATTSYGKGTSKGPSAILKASHYVEFFDEELKKELCFEKGICAVQEIKFSDKKGKVALDIIYKKVKDLIDSNKFVVSLGGEHTISSAIIKAHHDSYNDISVLHFDAHSDLRDEYEDTKYSHACFAARVAEFTTNITQVGIRAQCKEEYEFIKEKGIKTFFAFEIHSNKYGKNWDDKVLDTLNKNVYITFDVDYFDPSIMPSTGTPEPDGFMWPETTKLLKKLGMQKNVLGFDIVELSPVKSNPFPDFLAAKLTYKMLNYFVK
jgi:agmatinase